MRLETAIALTLSLFAVANARAERISLVGGTVINPSDGKVIPNATIVIERDS